MQTLKTKSLTWHHFLRPSANDLKWLERHFEFHPLVLAELAHPTMRPRVDQYDGYLYLVLHFPIFNEPQRKTEAREVDFILTKRELISVAYGDIPPLDDFFKKCSVEKSCQDLYASKTPAHLLFFVIKELYAFALRELDHIQENINRIEERVFATDRQEEAVIEELSFVRRDVIDFRRSLKPQQGTLEALAAHGVDFCGPALKPFFEEIIGEYLKVWNLIENNKEAIDALYDNNVAILNIRQNEAMKIVAVMAFITFPLMLFTALFSMNTIATPILGHPYDFWIILGIMIIATFGMFTFFKRKKWL